ncbi:ubiquitinyl hydrolase [Stylosanthes scabra]|uniref:Ubiquitinyl hydrolase n=1 Tax=Stylosanthes scabra TaxID=79078 RepID=A0ABU6QN64_9FABA|nr:ubiquitinyl hydrolase [Stylosanthes scabra]
MEIPKHTIHEQDIIEKMMLSIGQVFSLGSGMKFGRIVLRSAYEDILALFKKLKKKEQEGYSHHYYQDQDHYDNQYLIDDDDDISDLLQLIPITMAASMSNNNSTYYYQPSAPPIPDYSQELCVYSSSSNNNNNNNKVSSCEEEHDYCYEQVDFKGKGVVDIVYVPLLEKVCNDHPSLLESERRRSYEYSGWAFNALGRVLHFLETTRVEEMMNNLEACEWLKMLWDEVQVFGFELSWLVPQVEFALNMEKLMREVEKLEEEKKSIERRIQELRMELMENSKCNNLADILGDSDKNC